MTFLTFPSIESHFGNSYSIDSPRKKNYPYFTQHQDVGGRVLKSIPSTSVMNQSISMPPTFQPSHDDAFG